MKSIGFITAISVRLRDGAFIFLYILRGYRHRACVCIPVYSDAQTLGYETERHEGSSAYYRGGNIYCNSLSVYSRRSASDSSI